MRTSHKNKSRTRLYNAMMGAIELTGASGQSAVAYIDFGAVAIPGDTFQIGDYVFQFQLAASEAAGASAGTAADPHLVAHGANVLATVTNLAAKMNEETLTTAKWGFLHPDVSVGIVNDGTDRLTFTFWPGAAANSLTIVDGCATPGVVDQPGATTAGVSAKTISTDHRYSIINTTGSAVTAEYYTIEDGVDIGDTVEIFFKLVDATDAPVLMGHLENANTAYVMAAVAAGEDGKKVELMWNGSNWMTLVDSQGTALSYTAAA